MPGLINDARRGMVSDRREKRIAGIDQKSGGTFVYKGGAFDHEVEPEKSAVNEQGNTVIAKPAVTHKTEFENYELWGAKFPRGVPVAVNSVSLAFKLRCLPFMEEVAAGSFGAPSEHAEAPAKRGRPRKADVEV